MLFTYTDYLDQWNSQHPDQIWLRERKGDATTDWSWHEAHTEINAIACWFESRFADTGHRIGLLSRNRAHWYFADLGACAAGHVVVPMFTTASSETAAYVMNFTEMKVLFVGETENWNEIRQILPEDILIIALPGVELAEEHLRWEDLASPFRGSMPTYKCQADDLVSLVFTSGTTGAPKGVMQTHSSNLIPIARFSNTFSMEIGARFFSYLPLAHIAERQLVEGSSLVNCGEVHFNENLSTLLRDLPLCRPGFMFGPPRVWEQLQQGIIAQFGSQDAVDVALKADAKTVGKMIREKIGLDQADYLLTAAAPTPPALIHWYDRFGICLMEGFGQTECMGPIVSSKEERRVGSIGKPTNDIEVRVTEDDELLVKAPGCSPGYYKMPEKTAATFIDGWVHTGDKVRIDDDGFYYITGRVKDYFKTIQGKFVAPTPIENIFAENPYTEQICLLGRGYSKTTMTCVLSAIALELPRNVVEAALLERVKAVDIEVEKHARIGAVMISAEPWSIGNKVLTPTMKIRRNMVEELFGEKARELARKSAETKQILLHWC
jgi:long-chain acyl-CoA synthetase|tara:strand:+ start:13501 stop:15150 length:1650 start_codon:yes stop_codon:yes gene_type:complete